MKKIKLKLMKDEPGGTERIVARELNFLNLEIEQGGGHIEADSSEDVRWINKEAEPNTFEVTFFDKNDNDKQGWPFIDPKPVDMRLVLRWKSRKTLTLMGASSLVDRWKYKVEINKSGVDPLDPMIIIRGRSLRTKLVLAAVGGFVVGVATCLLLRYFGVD